MKELFFFMPIFDASAELIMSQINEHMGEEITVRALTPGGNVLAAYPICDKFKEHGNIHLKVDSIMSGGAFLPLFAKTSECLDVSRIMFHRADLFVENDGEQVYLDGINKDLKALMKKKVDAAKWKEITGITIDQLFDPETRVDIFLTGKQAVEIGLIDRYKKLTPQLQKEITASSEKYFQVAANAGTPTPSTNSIPETMTKEELQQKFPAVYAAIKTEGKTESKKEVLAEEQERVEGWAFFMDVDAKAVKEGIASGKKITTAQGYELMEKKMGKKEVTAVELDSEGKPLVTGAAPSKVVTAEEKKKADKESFLKEAMAQSEYLSTKK